MAEWTFVTNHALVLSFLAKQPRITAREMAASIGITERTVRKIIADLDAAGYITKKKQGRGIRYRINPDLTMRHDAHREIAVGDFLAALGWRRRQKHSRRKIEAGI
jgi:DNA-binding transcriptional ArsR family regulator